MDTVARAANAMRITGPQSALPATSTGENHPSISSAKETAKGIGDFYSELCEKQNAYCLPAKLGVLSKPLNILGKAEDIAFGIRDVLKAHDLDVKEQTSGIHTLRASLKSVARISTTALIWQGAAVLAAGASLPVALGIGGVAFAANLVVPDKVAVFVGWLTGE